MDNEYPARLGTCEFRLRYHYLSTVPNVEPQLRCRIDLTPVMLGIFYTSSDPSLIGVPAIQTEIPT